MGAARGWLGFSIRLGLLDASGRCGAGFSLQRGTFKIRGVRGSRSSHGRIRHPCGVGFQFSKGSGPRQRAITKPAMTGHSADLPAIPQ